MWGWQIDGFMKSGGYDEVAIRKRRDQIDRYDDEK